MLLHSVFVPGFLDPLAGGFPAGIASEPAFEKSEGFGGPFSFAEESDVGAFRGVDEFMGEKSHVFVLEDALEILIVSAFVGGESAGFGGRDGLASDRMKDGATLFPGVSARDLEQRELGIGGHAIELIELAVGGAGDATEKILVGLEDGMGSGPNGGAVLVESEFVEDEIAGETAGGQRIGGEDENAAGLALHDNARLVFHGLETVVRGEIDLFKSVAHEIADLGAFEVEFGAVEFGIGKNGDCTAGITDQAIDGPGGERERLSGLTAPEPDLDAVGFIVEGFGLVRTKGDE